MDADYVLFARIVESGSLSAAGRAVGLSPAMVSKRLARLEARLGAALVNRTTRRLALTETGERFHRDVLAILKAVEEAEARVAGQRAGPSGLLRVSAPTS
ncbi:MAG: LysR family transcriptional regulator, partial [Sphingomonadaceae bacterium]|nr:LysR family transcriptional regulator [Sphingomonadaceae bacterium]